jgi:hypothetical protein
MPPFRTWALTVGAVVGELVVAVAVSRFKLLAKLRVFGPPRWRAIDQVEEVPPPPPGHG